MSSLDLKEIKKELSVETYKEKISQEFEDLNYRSQKTQLELSEQEEIIKMRNEWSIIFKILLICIVVFEICITISVGLGWLEYEDEWFLRGGFA